MQKNTNDRQLKNQELRDAVGLLKETFRLFEKKFWQLIAVSFLSALSPIIAQLILNLSSKILTQILPPESVTGDMIFIGLSIVLSGLGIVFQAWSMATLITIAKEDKLAQPAIAYKMAANKIFPFFWVALIYISLIVAGTILFVVPGIIAAVWFCLAGAICVIEQKKGTEAMITSKNLIVGSWRMSSLFLSYLLALATAVLFFAALLKMPLLFQTLFTNTLAGAFFAAGIFVLYERLSSLQKTPLEISKKTLGIYSKISWIALAIFIAVVSAVVALAVILKDDAIQYNNAKIIQQALLDYKQKNGGYPQNLSELAPDYFNESQLGNYQKQFSYVRSENSNDFNLTVGIKYLGVIITLTSTGESTVRR